MDFAILIVEEERLQYNAQKLRRRQLRDANDPFDLEERTFGKLFRINKQIASQLVHYLENHLKRSKRSGLPVHIIVLTAVRFYAVGSYQRSIGQEFNLALGQSTVSKVVRDVSRAIVYRLMATFLKFPNTAAARHSVATEFENKFGVPDCLGCIDCTHIAIVTPYKNNPNNPPEAYRNRKGYYSINTQIICDVNCKILNVNARFPGSSHDAHIFNQSMIKGEMERLTKNRIGKYFLIGDSGYAKEAYMLTPVHPTPAEGTAEYSYNKKVASIRNCVERTNGILKSIFRCLRKDRVLHYQPDSAVLIILSCCTIYNMMHHFRFPLAEIEITEEVEVAEGPQSEIRTRQAALQRQREVMELINRT